MATATQTIDSIHRQIVNAVQAAGNGLGGRLDGDRVAVTRGRRPCGWIQVVDPEGNGRLELEYRLSRAPGAFNAALRGAGVCDMHWGLVQS